MKTQATTKSKIKSIGTQLIYILGYDRIVSLDLQIQLEKAGFKVINPVAQNLNINCLSKNLPDLVIYDSNYPISDEFINLITKNGVPVIYLGSIMGKQESIRLIPLAIFEKPFDSQSIINYIVEK